MRSTTARIATFGLTTVLGLALAGCAASLPPPGPEATHAVPERATVVIAPDAAHVLPFALGDGRVTGAARRLEAVLGHGVQVQVDAALVPADRDRFIQALAGAIDNAALALDDVRVGNRNAFTRSASRFHVLACRFDTVSNYVRSDLDEATGTLYVRLPGPPAEGPGVPLRALFEPVVVRHAIEGAYLAWLYTRFSGVAPHQVAMAEWGFYADYLARTRPTPPTRATTGMSRLTP